MGDAAQRGFVGEDLELFRSEFEIDCPYDVPTAIHGAAKRVLDLAIAIPLLIFVLPLMIGVAIAIKISDGGPVLFRHERFGRAGRTFICYKFRTMVTNASERLRLVLENDPEARAEWSVDHKLQNDPRITPLGKFLRRSSLDELPQLFNVIRGDMSLVGPRPITASEIAKYSGSYSYYTSTRPGVTGLWQVSGRNQTTYAERVALDVEYVRSWTILTDVIILIRTIPAVILSRGAF